MAWTAPRTWVANEVVTATLMNTHIKDNLVALSTHAHGGAAGAGNDELSGVDQVNFDDLSASPATAGRLQRNGNNLEWYGAAKVAFTEADAAAGTASPRTLGTGSTQAAAGDHGHSYDRVGILHTNVTQTDEAVSVAASSNAVILSLQLAASADLGFGVFHGRMINAAGLAGKVELLINSVVKDTRTHIGATIEYTTLWGQNSAMGGLVAFQVKVTNDEGTTAETGASTGASIPALGVAAMNYA